jgi:hypothetical protein
MISPMWIIPVLAFALRPLCGQEPILSFGFAQPEAPGSQSIGSLPDAEVHGDFGIPFPQTGDFGKSGYLFLPHFQAPVGAFTVEACFRLRKYAGEADSFSAVIMHASLPELEFSFRIGGGARYPITAGTAAPPNIWAQPLDSSMRSRAAASACVGSLSMATPSGHVIEAYTRTCVQLGDWVHLVAVWDGEIHLYLNGEYATDTARMLGYGTRPPQPAEAPIYIGARNASGAHHFNGEMAFVRMLSGALRGAENYRRFDETARAENDDFACQGAVMPEPVLFQGGCDMAYSKLTLAPQDSLEFQWSRDWDFRNLAADYRIPTKWFRLSDHKNRVEIADAPWYWRAKVIRGPVPPDSIPQVPIGIRSRMPFGKGTGTIRVRSSAGEPAPALYRIDGSRIAAVAGRVGNEWIINITP